MAYEVNIITNNTKGLVMKRAETTAGYLYFSQIPKENDLKLLSLEDDGKPIDIIWNLAADAVRIIPMEKLWCTEVLAGEIDDYSIPNNAETFHKQLNQVVSKLREGGKVFVHCVAGRGRTGMAIAAIKCMLDDFSSEEALSFSKENCQGPETNEQKFFIFITNWKVILD